MHNTMPPSVEISALLVRMALLAAMYVVMRACSRSMWVQAFLWWPATVMHELAHFVVGALLAAQPVDIALWPRKIAGTNQVILGHVAFTNLRWWKALPVGVAPLVLLLPLGCFLLVKSLSSANSTALVLLYSISALQCFKGCWPSPQDWAMARPAIWVIFFLCCAAGLVYSYF